MQKSSQIDSHHRSQAIRWRMVVSAVSLILIACFTASTPVFSQTVDTSEETAADEHVESTDPHGSDSDAEVEPVASYDEHLSLGRIRSLIELGTLELAYLLVVNARADYEHTSDWVEWETLFLELSRQLGAWQEMIDRANELRGTQIDRIAQRYAVQAEINLNQYDGALERARTLILQQPDDQETLIELRKMIAQVYLEQDDFEAAEIALALFDRDYRPSDPDWEHRYVRILLRGGKVRDAIARLAPLQTLDAQILDLYTQFRSRTLSPSETVIRGLEMLPQYENEPLLRAELWALIEVAARSFNDFEMQVEAIESSLSINYERLSTWAHLPVVPLNTESQLLETYDQFALSLGNDIGLIVGDDDSWYQIAQEFEITSPITARAVHAYLARNSYTSESRDRSTLVLADLFLDAGLFRLLEGLFVRTEVLDVAKVSHKVQTRLANTALRGKDYEKALKIINVMSKPEEPEKLEFWMLTQARIAISISDFERSEQLLDETINLLPLATDQAMIDRIMQVVFDLQERDQHDLAIRFFVNLYDKTSTLQSQREILRWISESYSAKGDFAMAIEHLLRSSELGNNWDDDWALSSRLQAGDEMVKAGLIDDARVIYTELQEDALDPRTRALITSRLNSLLNSESAVSQN